MRGKENSKNEKKETLEGRRMNKKKETEKKNENEENRMECKK
jgi:hypothetical protein